MFAVIFEVEPKPERWDDYLALAASLKPALETIDGFISVERFASAKTKGRLLSLSLWRDEKAVVRWRSHGGHHAVQAKGRTEIFSNYHLRVGEIGGEPHPGDDAAFVTICEAKSGGAPSADEPLGAIEQDLFESLIEPGKWLRLISWRDQEAADQGTRAVESRSAGACYKVRIVRDYGMFERGDAPQYHPPVPRTDA